MVKSFDSQSIFGEAVAGRNCNKKTTHFETNAGRKYRKSRIPSSVQYLIRSSGVLRFCLEWPKSQSLHTRKCNTHKIQPRSYNKRRVEGATFLTGHFPVPVPVPAAEFFTVKLKNSDKTKNRGGRL